MRKRKKKSPYLAPAIAIALVLIVFSYVYLLFQPVSASSKKIEVVIPKGSSVNKVATLLHEKGIVRSPYVFRYIASQEDAQKSIKPGKYFLSPSFTYREIVDILQKGAMDEFWVTYPEGFTVRQIADRLEEKGVADGDKFVDLAINHPEEFADFAYIQPDGLEGFLFPDTYLFSSDMPEKTVICLMLETFESKIVEEHYDKIESVVANRFADEDLSFSDGLYKLLTIASLVEREARKEEDRPKIAAVIWNRLGRNMRLEICATVTYEPGKSRGNKAKIYLSDLESDTPYNTYQFKGLPPGPICNPGEKSFEAVLSPDKVNYLYYVAKPDGGHIFSRTHSEHVKAKQRVRGN